VLKLTKTWNCPPSENETTIACCHLNSFFAIENGAGWNDTKLFQKSDQIIINNSFCIGASEEKNTHKAQ